MACTPPAGPSKEGNDGKERGGSLILLNLVVRRPSTSEFSNFNY
jgi:hypothetical protein